MNIGDLFLRVLADLKGFRADVVKEAEKSGDEAGMTLGQRMAAGVKKHGTQVLGTALAAGFAVATKGALELENAVARYQSATGASAEEAKAAGKVINRVAGEERASLEAVTEAAIRVKRDLQATGPEAEKLTKAFVRFARVTRQDAAGAVAAYDDILDAWGLTAADAVGIMDKLLVSQQRFGGEITETQATLAALAPAMRAANLEIDDGIALLGLFGSKGLDAGQASAAFAKALTKVKSPEELQHLIDDISATEDPFLRAQKAADLFGAKAGAKLANALGGTHLEDFTISMEDAAGATEHAAEVLDSTWSGRIQKWISIATANLREFGSAFGPALLGAASLASLLAPLGGGKLVKSILGPLVGLGGKVKTLLVRAILGAVIPARIAGEAVGVATGEGVATGAAKSGGRFGAIGKLWGSILGKAFVAAALAYIGIELWGQLQALEKENERQTKAIGERVGEQIATGTLEGLRQSQAALREGIRQMDSTIVFGDTAKAARKQLVDSLAAVDAEIADRLTTIAESTRAGAYDVGQAIPQGIGQGIADHSQDAGEAVRGRLFPALAKETEKWLARMRRFGGKTATEFAACILDAQSAVKSAFNALVNQQETELTRSQEIAYTIGVLTSKELAQGLKDGRPGVRAQAEELQITAIQRLEELVKNGKPIGRKGAEALRDGLKSENADVRAQARHTKEIIENALKPLVPAMDTLGTKAGNELARKLQSAITRAQIKARVVVNFAASANVTGQSGLATGGRPPVGVPSWVRERGRELIVPDSASTIIPHHLSEALAAAASRDRGGDTVNITVTGVGSDVSQAAARRFGQAVADEMAAALRVQRARTPGGLG